MDNIAKLQRVLTGQVSDEWVYEVANSVFKVAPWHMIPKHSTKDDVDTKFSDWLDEYSTNSRVNSILSGEYDVLVHANTDQDVIFRVFGGQTSSRSTEDLPKAIQLFLNNNPWLIRPVQAYTRFILYSTVDIFDALFIDICKKFNVNYFLVENVQLDLV